MLDLNERLIGMNPHDYNLSWMAEEPMMTSYIHDPYLTQGFADYPSAGHLNHLDTEPTFSIKRCNGYFRSDLDIDAEVVGWVIGKNGAAIKELKAKTSCNMWVDQKALKLTITGPDARIVQHAASSVQAYIASAPIKAGAVETAVTQTIDCPPKLLNILGDRGTISSIVKETRAQVVVNKKIGRAIIKGRPNSVRLACLRIQEILNAAGDKSADKTIDTMSDTNALNNSTSIKSPLSEHSWSLFSGTIPFNSVGVAPICGTPRSFLEQSRKMNHFSPSMEEETQSVLSPLDNVEENKDESIDSIMVLLSSLKLDKYKTHFTEHEVDMEAVELMTENDFMEMGIPKGPRLKILNAISRKNGATDQ
mmetsp:Transcript_20849/g.30911  ORF Transcript_20849/g.30911 Transcript_20849/m.30911 type:complete len:364 (-) Transcript_20849:240-1331(-)